MPIDFSRSISGRSLKWPAMQGWLQYVLPVELFFPRESEESKPDWANSIIYLFLNKPDKKVSSNKNMEGVNIWVLRHIWETQ